MKIGCAISVFLLAIGAIAIVGECSIGQVALPDYEQGNRWTYRMNMTCSQGFVLLGTLEMEIGETETILIESVSYTTIRNDILGYGTFVGVYEGFNVSGNWTMVGLENWDIASLEIARSQITVVFHGVLQMGAALNFSLTMQNTTFNEIIQDSWSHPYDVGDSGNVTLARTSNESLAVEIEGTAPIHNSTDWSGYVDVTYSCSEHSQVTVPAGTFQTCHVVRAESNGFVEDNFYSQEVGAGVLIKRSIGGVLTIGEWELLSYSYAESPSSTDEGLPLLYWLIPVAVVIFVIVIALYLERRAHK